MRHGFASTTMLFCLIVPKNIAGTFVTLVVLCECAVVPYETSGNLSRCILSSDTIAECCCLLIILKVMMTTADFGMKKGEIFENGL